MSEIAAAGCAECGRPVDRVLPDPMPDEYECMWSEAFCGRAIYCQRCYDDVPSLDVIRDTPDDMPAYQDAYEWTPVTPRVIPPGAER